MSGGPIDARVLLVEDEEDLAFLVAQNLRAQGFEVTLAGDLARGRAAAAERAYDLLIIDVGLPDGEGFDLLRERRKDGDLTPAIFLTARSTEQDRLLGFAIGGDDYVGKPFSMAELIARASAIVRRARGAARSGWEGAGFRVDFERYVLVRDGEEHALTHLESELLRYLIGRRGEAVSRRELLDRVWGYDSYPSTRTVDTHVHALRRKLEPDPGAPRHLLTVHGIGYKFVE